MQAKALDCLSAAGACEVCPAMTHRTINCWLCQSAIGLRTTQLPACLERGECSWFDILRTCY